MKYVEAAVVLTFVSSVILLANYMFDVYEAKLTTVSEARSLAWQRALPGCKFEGFCALPDCTETAARGIRARSSRELGVLAEREYSTVTAITCNEVTHVDDTRFAHNLETLQEDYVDYDTPALWAWLLTLAMGGQAARSGTQQGEEIAALAARLLVYENVSKLFFFIAGATQCLRVGDLDPALEGVQAQLGRLGRWATSGVAALAGEFVDWLGGSTSEEQRGTLNGNAFEGVSP